MNAILNVYVVRNSELRSTSAWTQLVLCAKTGFDLAFPGTSSFQNLYQSWENSYSQQKKPPESSLHYVIVSQQMFPGMSLHVVSEDKFEADGHPKPASRFFQAEFQKG